MADSLPQNVTAFAWTKGKAQAAVRLAEDDLSDEQIADEAGVNRRTLDRWKQHPEFAARVKDLVAEMTARAQRRGFARRERRIDRYNRRLDQVGRVLDEELDTGLLREERKLLQQLAQDIGQWAEKHEITGPDGGAVPIRYITVADEAAPDGIG